MSQKILSIITPYYNTLPYTLKLVDVLVPQLNDFVEWIIVDDGCCEEKLDEFGVTVIHLEYCSGGASVPRNVGLDCASGEYIAFIDSDDMVSCDYVSTILNKIKNEEFDYCYLSWGIDEENQYIIKDEPEEWNSSVWNCIYRRSLIGDNRFPRDIVLGEDKDFNARVRHGKKAHILDVIYYYTWPREGSIVYNSLQDMEE